MYRVGRLIARPPHLLLRPECFYPSERRHVLGGPPERCGIKLLSTVEAAVEQTAHPARLREKKTLTMATLNPQVKAVEYAVRGPIVLKAGDIERGLQQVSGSWTGELAPGG